jgi:Ala-tRNA(Pro) deacylase
MKKDICRVPKKVDEFLKKNASKFEFINHKKVFTAYDKAATLKIKPSAIGKVLVLRLDKDLAMVLIPGDKNLDFVSLREIPHSGKKLKQTSMAKKIDFVKEAVIKNKFKGVDPGAIPPLCGLWGMKVFVDRTLMGQAKIIMSAGSYEWSIKMTPAAFKKLTPDLVVGNFAKPKERKLKQKKKK